MMWVAGALVFLLFRSLAGMQKKRELATGRYMNFFEPFVIYVRDEMVYPIMGSQRGRKYLPLFLTQFFFILFANLLGLIPWMSTATGNLAVTGSLALTTLCDHVRLGDVRAGRGAFLEEHGAAGDAGLVVAAAVSDRVAGPVHQGFALTIRLFANMMAGHIVILTFIGLIFIFQSYFVAVPR